MRDTNASLYVRRIAISAMLLSLALVLKTFFSIYIPLFGQNGMSVGISGIFSMLPSILFGPIYGAAVSGLSDLMGYLLKPIGAYMPLMTLTAALSGLLRGGAYIMLKWRRNCSMRIIVAVFAVLLLVVGIANIACLNMDGVDSEFYERVPPDDADAAEMSPISRLLILRTATTKNPSGNLATYMVSVTAGPIACGLLGVVLLLVDIFASKWLGRRSGRVAARDGGRETVNLMALLLAVIVSGIIVTSINTVILRDTIYVSWKTLPFLVVWVPRVIEEIVGGAVKVCFMAMLMQLFVSQPSLRRLART